MIGVGTDLVDVDRMREVLHRRESFKNRVFRETEQAYAERQNDPTQRYAARFAAKEATLKSLGLGLGGMALRDIEVVNDPDSGAPSLRLHGAAAEVAAEHGAGRFMISLSHTHRTASAVVIALSS